MSVRVIKIWVLKRLGKGKGKPVPPFSNALRERQSYGRAE